MDLNRKKKCLSIITAAFNEAEGLRTFYNELARVIVGQINNYDWEIIFVDDGSTDGTRNILKELRQKDQRVKWLSLSRNFGHQAALSAGLENAKGDAVIMMDCDLQHPVSLLPNMIKKWEEGFDIVFTTREDGYNNGILKKITSAYFYGLINRMSCTRVNPSSADFRLMSRKALDALLKLGEYHRFIRGMASWIGFKTCEIKYKQDNRYARKSRYTFKKMLNLAFDGITSFSIIPLRISAILGIFIFFGALAYALYAVLMLFIKPESIQAGWTSLLVIVNLLGGAILLFLGLIGEYIGRIYEQAKARPIYLIDELEGIEDDINQKIRV